MRCLMYRPEMSNVPTQRSRSSKPAQLRTVVSLFRCHLFARNQLRFVQRKHFWKVLKNRDSFDSSLSFPAGAVLLRSERPRDDGEEGGEDQKSGFRQVSKAELLMRTMSFLEHILTYVDQVMNEEQKAREFHANPVPRAVETGGRCIPHLIPVHTRSTFTHRNHYSKLLSLITYRHWNMLINLSFDQGCQNANQCRSLRRSHSSE